MKTKVFFAGILLLSGTTFAQEAFTRSESSTKLNAAAKSSKGATSSSEASGTSAAHLNTNAGNKAEAQAGRTKENVNERAMAKKEAISSELKSDVEKAKETSRSNKEVSAGVNSEVGITAAAEGNKTGNNASLSTQAAVSSKNAVNSGKKIKTEGLETAGAHTSAVIEGANTMKVKTRNELNETGAKMQTNAKRVNGKVSSSANASVNAAATAGQRMQTKVKHTHIGGSVKTSVKSNAGLRIK